MGAAVDDVHQRHGQHARARPAQVLVERQPDLVRGRARHRHRHAQHRVGADLALVGRAVDRQHRGVEPRLVERVAPDDHRPQHLGDVVARLADALAQVALLVAVAQLQRLVLAGRRARRHGGGADRAGLQLDVDLDGRIAARIQDLAGQDALDDGFLRE